MIYIFVKPGLIDIRYSFLSNNKMIYITNWMNVWYFRYESFDCKHHNYKTCFDNKSTARGYYK